MERAILVIVVIVAVVGIVSLLSTLSPSLGPADALTGQVILDANTPTDCSSCSGYAPVCAKINNKYITFSNSCEAKCTGAKIAVKYPCEQVPRS